MATWYVSPAGNDLNPGTLAAPWRTLGSSVSPLKLAPGDTLYLRGNAGNYVGAENTIHSDVMSVSSGTSWAAPITIAGYPGDPTPFVQPPDAMEAVKLTTGAPHYLIFQDFIVDGSLHANENVDNVFYGSDGSHHIRMLRLTIQNTLLHGLSLSPNNNSNPWSTYWEIQWCVFHHIGRTVTPVCGCQLHAMYIGTSDNLFENSEYYACQDTPINIYSGQGDTSSRNVIRKNRVHDCFNVRGVDQGTSAGILVSHGDSNQVYDNIVYHCHNVLGGQAGGYQAYTNATNTVFANNAAYDLSHTAFFIQYCTGTILRNNTTYLCGTDYQDLGTGTIQDHNSFGVDPLYVNPSGGNFYYQAGSPLIDAGVTIAAVVDDIVGTARPQGAAYDTGPYEYIFAGGTVTGVVSITAPTPSLAFTAGVSMSGSLSVPAPTAALALTGTSVFNTPPGTIDVTAPPPTLALAGTSVWPATGPLDATAPPASMDVAGTVTNLGIVTGIVDLNAPTPSFDIEGTINNLSAVTGMMDLSAPASALDLEAVYLQEGTLDQEAPPASLSLGGQSSVSGVLDVTGPMRTPLALQGYILPPPAPPARSGCEVGNPVSSR